MEGSLQLNDPIDFIRDNGNYDDRQPQYQAVQFPYVSLGGINQGVIQYYLLPAVPVLAYLVQMPYPMHNAQMVGPPNVYQMPPRWPSYNTSIGLGKSNYSPFPLSFVDRYLFSIEARS